MANTSLQQLGVLTENFASQEQKLRAFSTTLTRLQDELAGMITDLAWDRARLASVLAVDTAEASCEPLNAWLAPTETADDVSVGQADTTTDTQYPLGSAAITDATETLETAQVEPIAAEIGAVDDVLSAQVVADDTAPDLVASAVPGIDVTEQPADPSTETLVIAFEADLAETAAPTEIDATAASVAAETVAQADAIVEIAALAPVEATASSDLAAAPIEIEAQAHAIETNGHSIVDAVPAKIAATPVNMPATADIEKPANPIVDLAARRQGRARMLSRSVAAVASLLLIAGAPLYYEDLLQTDFGLRLSRLGACNVQAVASENNCAVLAWLAL